MLYLTHGNTDDRNAWLWMTSAERYASDRGLITVMTSTWSSFGMDMYYGKKYFTYLSEELVPLMDRLLPIAPGHENHFVAGLSLGGYISFKLGLVRNDYFSAIGAFSSPIDMVDTLRRSYEGTTPGGKDFEECFGNLEYMAKWPNDTMAAARDIVEKGKPMPRLYQECGFDDFTFEQNEASSRQLKDMGYDVTYISREGDHGWEFWDEALPHFLDFIEAKKTAHGQLPGLALPRAYEPCEMPAFDIRGAFESFGARGTIDCEFILPPETPQRQWKAGKVMIHPTDDDFTYWQRKRDLEKLAEEQGIAIGCLQLYDSLGYDQEHGREFGILVEKELPFLFSFCFGHGREVEFKRAEKI